MLDEQRIAEALDAKAGEHQLSPELLERIKRSHGATAGGSRRSQPGLWTRLRLGAKLEIAAACLLFVSLVAVAGLRSHQPTPAGSSPTAPEGTSPPPTPAVTGFCTDPAVAQNLHAAANAKLPVRTTVITTTYLPAPTERAFTDQIHGILRPHAEGWSSVEYVGEDRALIRLMERAQYSPAATYLEYTFPRGDLNLETELTEKVVAQFQAALANLQVAAARVDVTTPSPGPTAYLFWSGALDLRTYADQYTALPANFCDQWHRQPVPVSSAGKLANVTVNILNLGNGMKVGFPGTAFVTQSIKSGTMVTTWYEIPGLAHIDGTSTSVVSSPPADKLPSVADLRKRVAFPIFVPTALPPGFVPRPPAIPAIKPDVVSLAYTDAQGSEGLNATIGPAGCCLDGDGRKNGQATPIRKGITGHFLLNQPEFGGSILWWNEAGAYIAISGPQLTREELIRIANSMSATADLNSGPP